MNSSLNHGEKRLRIVRFSLSVTLAVQSLEFGTAALEPASAGSIAFTVASVPTGMNAGDSTAPWCVVKTPARAAPAVVSMSNWNSADLLDNSAGCGR